MSKEDLQDMLKEYREYYIRGEITKEDYEMFTDWFSRQLEQLEDY